MESEETEKTTSTVDEIYALLKNSSLPTVLVEGKDDIIFYRAIEEDLKHYGIDMLPAGNKWAVLNLRERLIKNPVKVAVLFVVDNDLWVHKPPSEDLTGLITTNGYAIENDLFSDGELLSFMDGKEKRLFEADLKQFVCWYSLAVNRYLTGVNSAFRTHPNKILDDSDGYISSTTLQEGEEYPEELYNLILGSYGALLRGKSLFALLLRRLSAKNRMVKFSAKQLMAICASRKGRNYQALCVAIENELNAQQLKLSSRGGTPVLSMV